MLYVQLASTALHHRHVCTHENTCVFVRVVTSRISSSSSSSSFRCLLFIKEGQHALILPYLLLAVVCDGCGEREDKSNCIAILR